MINDAAFVLRDILRSRMRLLRYARNDPALRDERSCLAGPEAICVCRDWPLPVRMDINGIHCPDFTIPPSLDKFNHQIGTGRMQ